MNKTMYFENIEEVKQYANEIICFYSDNDPYVKYEVEKDTSLKLFPNSSNYFSLVQYPFFGYLPLIVFIQKSISLSFKPIEYSNNLLVSLFFIVCASLDFTILEEIYYWNGNCKIIMICTPAWYKAQCKLLES